MIPLTQGQYAKVDEEDYDGLMQFHWHAQWSPGMRGFYAQRKVRRADGSWTVELMHRQVTGFQWEKVDHKKNRHTLDNRKANLRDGTLHNGKNRTPQGGTSQYHGVCWHKGRQKWTARIRVDGVLKFLGLFDDEIEAAAAYDAASLKHHDDYGTRNFSQL
jgi:hypothetical protein